MAKKAETEVTDDADKWQSGKVANKGELGNGKLGNSRKPVIR